MILRPTPVSTKRFTWCAAARVLVADASDLLDRPYGRVYDDACDVGLTIVSHRTGREIVCVLIDRVKNTEGEVLVEILRPVRPQDHGLFEVHVLND